MRDMRRRREVIGPDEIMELELVKKIRGWILSTEFSEFRDAITARVIGQKAVEYILVYVYGYLRSLVRGRKNTENTLVAAPSGSGKTETYRALREYFAEKIPGLIISCYSMTNMTENGYKGDDVNSLLVDFFKQSGENKGVGIGIVFMDEFDKKLIPSYSSNGANANQAVQAQLLTMIEGSEVWNKDKTAVVDTNYTMFIGLGAFDKIRSKRQSDGEIHVVAFGSEKGNAGKKEHYDEISVQDIIDIGASYELMGRFPNLVNFHELGGKAIDKIIDSKLKELGEETGCLIKVSKGMRKLLHEKANSEFGCRIFDSILKTAIRDAKLEILYGGYDPDNCTITIKSENKASLKVLELPKEDTFDLSDEFFPVVEGECIFDPFNINQLVLVDDDYI